jgi:antibiotic biosynthesis monooxygenase (ABM) superfamily enzyme
MNQTLYWHRPAFWLLLLAAELLVLAVQAVLSLLVVLIFALILPPHTKWPPPFVMGWITSIVAIPVLGYFAFRLVRSAFTRNAGRAILH